MSILEIVAAERNLQDEKWGGPKWKYLAEVRFAGGRMFIRAKRGGYWVVTTTGENVPQDELVLRPKPEGGGGG